MDVVGLRFGFCMRQYRKKDYDGKHIAQEPVELRKLP